jgi:uncharacterized protein
MHRLLPVVAILVFFACSKYQDKPPTGTWKAGYGRFSERFEVYLQVTDSGALFSRWDEEVYALPLIYRSRAGEIHFSDKEGRFHFEGRWLSDTTFSGWLASGPDTFELDFRPTREHIVPWKPQEPRPPFPYIADTVYYPSRDPEASIFGILTLPDTIQRHPAIVLISGSGPQDHNSAIFGHKLFLVLADHLTRNGIAVLRWDDRGAGQTTGPDSLATSRTYALDALGGFDFLRQHPNIRPDAIGLHGHSEGGIIAPMAAIIEPEVAFLVLVAPPAVDGGEVLVLQSRLLREAMSADPEGTAINERILVAMLKQVRLAEREKWNNARLKESLENEIKSIPEDDLKQLGVDSAYMALMVRQMGSPWFRHFVAYDPAPALEQTRVPVLAIFGSLDLQVPPSQNAGPMEEALGRAPTDDYTIVTLPRLNHLMQTAEKGHNMEYAGLDETAAPLFLKTISDWLVERFVKKYTNP